jgi:iron complex transport system ATP-binding protein
MTVFDCVVLGRKPYIKWSLSQEDINLCDSMIDQVGLAQFKLRYINELSGGELQKVMLARAFVQQPQLLLLDEPTSNLDPKNQYEMLALVRQLARERNISVLIVIHDLNLALRYCDKFVFIREGVVYRYGDASTVTSKTIFDVYGINAVVTEVNGKKTAVIG